MNKYDNRLGIDTNKTSDVMHNLNNMGLENIQKLSDLQIKISKDNLQYASDTINALTTNKTPQQLFENVNQITKNKIKANNGHYQDLVSIMSDAKSKLIQTSVENFKLFNMHNWFNVAKSKDSRTSEIIDILADSSDKILNDSKDIADKTAKAANETIDAVTSATKEMPKTITVKKSTPAKPKATAPKKSVEKSATENTKTNDTSKDTTTDKVVEEAAKAV